jgi:hypothetical protein
MRMFRYLAISFLLGGFIGMRIQMEMSKLHLRNVIEENKAWVEVVTAKNMAIEQYEKRRINWAKIEAMK